MTLAIRNCIMSNFAGKKKMRNWRICEYLSGIRSSNGKISKAQIARQEGGGVDGG